MSLRNTVAPIAVVGLLGALVSTASAQVIVLNRPGVFVLPRDLNVRSGDAILVTSDGVTIDLNGHSVSTRSPGAGRGIVVRGARGVVVKNGRVGAFQTNVSGEDTENLTLESLQILGAGLAPAGGPSEIGISLVNSRAALVRNNTISSVNLGLIVRGAASGGNRVIGNSVVGGTVAGNNLLGMCWNPLAGGAATDPGPSGDLASGNHISQYQNGFSASAGSRSIVFKDNVISFFAAAFTERTFSTPENHNVSSGNIENPIP